jgi:Spy/CpxP family protein refolding chaperone
MNPARYKTLVAIIAVLLLSNIAMLVYFVGWKNIGKGHGEKHKSPMAEFLQKEIGFTPQQLVIFDSLRQNHRNSVKSYFDEISKSRDSLYQLIGEAPTSDSVMRATASIGNRQAALELRLFQNLRQIRALCTPEQVAKFDSLAPSLVHKMISQSRRPGPPPRPDSSRDMRK